MTGAAEIDSGPEGGIAAVGVVEVASGADLRGPGEAGVEVEDAADGPAAYNLLKPAVAAAEDDGLPDAIDLEGLAYVVVRPAPGERRVEGVRVLVVGLGGVIHALGPLELRIQLEVVRHGVFDAEKKRVVVRGAVAVVEVHQVDKGVESNTLRHGSDVGVGLQDVVVPQVGRVPKGSYELIAEVVLGIEREVLGISRGQVRRKGSD